MPNVKFYVDEDNIPELNDKLRNLLPELREFLCRTLKVEATACQFAIINVIGLTDQPSINTELHLLPGPGRSTDYVRGIALQLRDILTTATGLTVAVRVSALDPTTYIALK